VTKIKKTHSPAVRAATLPEPAQADASRLSELIERMAEQGRKHAARPANLVETPRRIQ